MEKIELNPEFRKALRLMEEADTHVFVTGRAGTGKSTLLRYFRDHTEKNIAVLAPTGVAAVNIAGQTIHSFFGFRPDITAAKVSKNYKRVRKAKMYRQLDALVIDEISMVRADLLDCVNEFLKMHGSHRGQVFGGVQMIFIGDLYQLPPVVRSSERQLFESIYESPYFFSAHAMGEADFEIVELEKIYRQQDEQFIEILNGVRNRSIDAELLHQLNTRHEPDFVPDEDDFYIYLTTTNAQADTVNNYYLNRLDSREFTVTAEVQGDFDEKSSPVAVNLRLKVGSQIMLANNDRAGRWINGTVGKINEIMTDDDRDFLLVELASGEAVEVYPHTWEMYRFYFDEKTKRVDSETVGSFTQFPVTLAWAITIHKSQGKTFPRAIIDFGRGTFAHGQAYVALSRCVSLDGLILRQLVQKRHILMDWKVSEFLTRRAYQKGEKQF